MGNINSGMIKQDVPHRQQAPSRQHFLFSSILTYNGPAPPTTENEDDDARRSHGHVHGGLGAAGQREVGWGDCCGIPVPSAFAVAKAE